MKRKIAIMLIIAVTCGFTACGAVTQDAPQESIMDQIEKLNAGETEESSEEPSEFEIPSEIPEETTEIPEDTRTEEPETSSGSETAENNSEKTTEDTAEDEIPDISEITVSSPEDAELLLKARFGTKDDETDFSYSFGYIGVLTVDGVEYYAFIWSWLVDNDHLSRLTEVFVQTDGSAIYEGEYNGETCEFYTGNMLDYE